MADPKNADIGRFIYTALSDEVMRLLEEPDWTGDPYKAAAAKVFGLDEAAITPEMRQAAKEASFASRYAIDPEQLNHLVETTQARKP